MPEVQDSILYEAKNAVIKRKMVTKEMETQSRLSAIETQLKDAIFLIKDLKKEKDAY